jgi:hypothetical protein
MGKNCLTNAVDLSVTYNCSLPLHGVKALHLVPFEEVASYTTDPSGANVLTFSLVSGGHNYKIEGFKQNIQYTEELVEGDYSNFVKPTVTFRKPANVDFNGVLYSSGLINRRFVAFVVFNEPNKKLCLGLLNPMVVRAMERDSNANGGSTMYTLSTEDGNTAQAIHDAGALA